jgi:hypothetical protein
MPRRNEADLRQRVSSRMRALLRDLDHRIAQSKRLTLVQLGYRGERLEQMLKKLRGNPRKKE